MTCDTLREVKILSKFQVPSPYDLGVKVECILGGKGRVNQSMNHNSVCRTAPASPGLLKIQRQAIKKFSINKLFLLEGN